MYEPKAFLTRIGITAIAAVVLSLAIPVPAQKDWLNFHSYFALSLLIAVLYVGAALLFFKGLASFKAALKRAYGFLCVGLGVVGIANLQLPVLMAANQLDGLWKQSGIIIVPYVIGLLFVFIGSRSFARLLGVKNIKIITWLYVCTPLLLAPLLAFIPHAPTYTPELEFDATNAFAVWNGVTILSAALMIYLAKQVAGVLYANALAWLMLAQVTMPIASVGHLVSIFLVGDDRSNIIAIAAMGPLTIAGVFLLRSAYSFNRITAEQGDIQGWVPRDFFGKPLQPKNGPEVATSISIVSYATSLVSNPKEIDTILDSFGQITSSLAPGEKLGDEREQRLLEIYLQIEEYLLSAEPLRKFVDRNAIRQHIANALSVNPATTFWGSLT